MRDRERDRERDRQTERETDRQREKKKKKKRERASERARKREREREREERERERERWAETLLLRHLEHSIMRPLSLSAIVFSAAGVGVVVGVSFGALGMSLHVGIGVS